MPLLKIELTVDCPYDVTGSKRELKDFIHAAVTCWGKQRMPEDWLWDALDEVKVGPVRQVPGGKYV